MESLEQRWLGASKTDACPQVNVKVSIFSYFEFSTSPFLIHRLFLACRNLKSVNPVLSEAASYPLSQIPIAIRPFSQLTQCTSLLSRIFRYWACLSRNICRYTLCPYLHFNKHKLLHLEHPGLRTLLFQLMVGQELLLHHRCKLVSRWYKRRQTWKRKL